MESQKLQGETVTPNKRER